MSLKDLTLSTMIIIMALLVSIPCAYGVKSSRIQIHRFPQPPAIKNQVRFWEAIFDKYTQNEAVIHDTRFPHIVVDIIDFQTFSKKYNRGNPYTRKGRSALANKYIQRYNKAIERVRKQGRMAVNIGPMEKRIFKVYNRDRKAYKALRMGKATLRSQTGLKDEFARAAKRAKSYLPYMERTFRKHRLPKDLTRMVFVESMFNLNAVSKVGASGIWQFMPRTGRLFLKVNKWIDERNSPLKATEAAAKLLKSNYRALGSWPLAITAYNHGVGGMKRAKRRLGTSDFGTIVEKYRSRTFGFASRNFYGEFIAAKNVFNRRYARQTLPTKTPKSLSKVTLKSPWTLKNLVKRTPLTESLITKHNPEFNRKTLSRFRYKALPRNYQIIIPTKHTKAVKRVVRSTTRRL